jgi:hypothetical protein
MLYRILFGIVIFIIFLINLKLLLDIKECFVPEYLNYKSKCFDCEDQIRLQYGNDGIWRANPTKSFDSELSGMQQTNQLKGGFLGKSLKYY